MKNIYISFYNNIIMKVNDISIKIKNSDKKEKIINNLKGIKLQFSDYWFVENYGYIHNNNIILGIIKKKIC
jgi:hypothetical protein